MSPGSPDQEHPTLVEVTNKFPRKIKIGPYQWEVKPRYGGGSWGETHFASTTITLLAEAHEQIQQETLMHEVLHAMFFTATIGLSTKQEEHIVAALSPLLITTLRENPELVEFWLQHEDQHSVERTA